MVGVRIDHPKEDDRIERIIADPAQYFSEARERARHEVEQEIAQEHGR